MASISAVIVPAKVLKDGRHKIRVSVAHNGMTRYIVTDIIVESTREFKNGSIVRRPDAAFLNTKLSKTLGHYREAIENIDYTDGLSCPELVELMKSYKRGSSHTLETIFEEYKQNSRAKASTLKVYATGWSTITKHLNKNLLLSQINHATVLGLDKFLKDRKLSPTTRYNYMALLSSVIGYATNCGYVTYKVNPFFRYRLPQPEVRDVWLSVDEVRKIRDSHFSCFGKCVCRDLFMLSYYLGGINITDLFDIDFNACESRISYVRKKTKNLPKKNKTVDFEIPEEAKAIIEKYKGKNGRICIADRKGETSLSHIKNVFEYGFDKIANELGIKRLVYYSARKSFSQHAYELGINGAVIDYILGHNIGKGGKMLFNYVYVTPEMATEAIRKVLDNLK